MNLSRLDIGVWLLAILWALVPLGAWPDTYDARTLVAITAYGPEDVKLLYDSRVDILGRRGDVYRALLTPAQLKDLTERGLKIEILTAEMERDRALWAEADAAAAARLANSYYTASKFNASNPATGTLMEHLLQLYNAHADICRLVNLGATQDGAYDIVAIKVSKNPDTVEAEPKIRIYGNIHGDEKGGMMVACDVLDWILANYASSATAQKLVDQAEIWFIPMGNPWGNANNSRYNSRSVDLNRNFWGPNGSDDGYPSAAAWTEKETQIIRDLTAVTGKRFTTSLSFHGGETCFNSIWNYSHDAPSDEPIFWSSRTGGSGCGGQTYCPTIAPNGLAKAYQDGCTTSGFWFTEGYDWYGTWGDTNDWSYGQWTNLDTTIEVTVDKTPATSRIPAFCAEHRQAVLNYMLKTFQGISGVMTNAACGTPLDGTVTAVCTTAPHTYQAIFTDPVAGDFHRVLQPGTYTVTCSAAGYSDTVVAGVVVTADTTTACNCSMGCASNPCSVSVTPDGPLALCGSASQVLTCTASGGAGFAYQWYDGASPISGATSGTYAASDDGTHSYNCKVTGSGCSSGLFDTAATTITRNAPTFAGVASVVNPQGSACTLNLAWSTASSPCAGTITYKVYRSTTTPVSIISGNLIASGVSGTSYADSISLTSGTMYHYVVRAVDGAGNEDTNTAEKSGTPTGSVSSSTLFSESFDGTAFPPSGWSQVDVSGSSGEWKRATATVHPSGTAPNSGAGLAYFNSYNASNGNSTRLYRSSASAIPSAATLATLNFFMYHDTNGSSYTDRIQVQVSTDGTTWTSVGTAVNRHDGTTGWKKASISLNAYIGQSVHVGLLGVSNYGWDCHIDDASLDIQTAVACTNTLPVPGETAPGYSRPTAQTWSDKTTLTWLANPQATSGYKVVLGTPSNLPYLLNATTDSCVKWTGTGTTCTLSDVPVSGSFYWCLVIGTNASGDGHPGNSTSGIRTVNSTTGTCP